MNFQRQLKEFLALHKTTGWIIVLMVGSLAVQALLFLILSIFNVGDSYLNVVKYFSLPSSIQEFIYQPWSFFTWIFVCADRMFGANLEGDLVFQGTGLWRYFIDGVLIWGFGRIHQQLLGESPTRRLILLSIPVIGILTLLVSLFFFPTATASHLYLTGWTPLMVLLVVSSATLVPDFPVQLFLFGRVKIMWIAIILVAFELLVAGFIFTPLGIAITFAAIFGFLHIYLLKQGTDITETVWNYYQVNKTPPPKMKVKYGNTFRQEKKEEKGKQKTTSTNPEDISQDEIDNILDKISDHGYESLSRREKEILFRASSQKEDENT